MASSSRFGEKIEIKTYIKRFRSLNLGGNKEYADIKQAELEGNLPESKGNTSPRAAYRHKDRHLYEIVDYNDGTSEKVVKEECIKNQTDPLDDQGIIQYDLSEVDEARRILRSLKAVNKKVTTTHRSAMSEEEILGPPPPPKSRGGRGNTANRQIVRRRPC